MALQNDNPHLEFYCSHPYFLKPSDIKTLLLEVGIQMNDVKHQKKSSEEEERALKVFDSDALTKKVLGTRNDWKDRLDYIDKVTRRQTSAIPVHSDIFQKDTFCYYMTTMFKAGKVEKSGLLENRFKIHGKSKDKITIEDKRKQFKVITSQLSELLVLVRHKLSHPEDLPEKGRVALCGSKTFNQHGFIQNLIIGFPNLVPFLGIRKGKKEKLKKLDYYRNGLACEVSEFAGQLKLALEEHLIKGGLEKRYTSAGSSLRSTVEFRTANHYLHIPDGITTMGAIFDNKEMSVIWSYGDQMEKITYEGLGNSILDKTTILFNRQTEKVQVDCKFLTECNIGNRLIILPGKVENINEVIQTLSTKYKTGFLENHVTWQDVSQWKEYVMDQKLAFHNQNVPFKCVPLCSDPDKTSVLEILTGAELNDILKGKIPIVFDKCKIPPMPQVYLKRRLLERITLDHGFVVEALEMNKEVFIICGASYRQICTHLSYLRQKPVEIKNGGGEIWKYRFPEKLSTNLFVMESDVESSMEIFNAIKTQKWHEGLNIHCLRYDKGIQIMYFSWLGTIGKTTFFQNFAEKILAENNVFLKDKLPEKMLAENNVFLEDRLPEIMSQKVRTVLIADQPGMGKSALMISLANKLLDSNNGPCGFLEIESFIQKLSEGVKESVLDRDLIINSIAELLCSSNFKKQVAKLWINGQVLEQAKVDIMFDGLDEAKPKSRNLFVKALNVIAEEIPTTRVWVSMRDSLHEHVPKFKHALELKIVPFSKQDQVDYIYWHLNNYVEKNRKPTGAVATAEELKSFAEKCTHIKILDAKLKIGGIPLHCYILFQVHAERVLANKLSLEQNSSSTSVELYQQLIHQKYLIYLREMGMVKSDVENTDLLISQCHFYKQNYSRMLQLHIYYALKLILSEDVANWFMNTVHPQIAETDLFTSDMLSFGLIESLEPVRFLHRTFAEYIVALFFQQVLTGTFDLEISPRDKHFRETLWDNCLKFNTSSERKNMEFMHPTVVYFLDSCLPSSLTPAQNDKINTAMSGFLFDKFPWQHFGIKSSYDIKRYFEIQYSCFFPFRNIFTIAIENEETDFQKNFIMYAKRNGAVLFPYLNSNCVCELVAKLFMHKHSLFVVQPTTEIKNLIKTILNPTSGFDNNVYFALDDLMKYGNLQHDMAVDYVNFFVTEIADNNGKALISRQDFRDNTLILNALTNKTCTVKLINFLAKLGSDINLPNECEKTCLMLAAENNRFDIFETLLSLGANMQSEDDVGKHVVNYVSCSGSIEMMESMIQRNFNISQGNKWGENALHTAIKESHLHVVKFLLEKEPTLIDSIKTDGALGVLHLAVTCDNNVELTNTLIANNANLLHQDSNGDTALQLAIKCGRFSVAKILLQAGSNIYTLNKEMECGVYLALKVRYFDIMKLIVDADNTDCKNCGCELHRCIRENFENIYAACENKQFGTNEDSLCFICNEKLWMGCKCRARSYALLHRAIKLIKSTDVSKALIVIQWLAAIGHLPEHLSWGEPKEGILDENQPVGHAQNVPNIHIENDPLANIVKNVPDIKLAPLAYQVKNVPDIKLAPLSRQVEVVPLTRKVQELPNRRRKKMYRVVSAETDSDCSIMGKDVKKATIWSVNDNMCRDERREECLEYYSELLKSLEFSEEVVSNFVQIAFPLVNRDMQNK